MALLLLGASINSSAVTAGTNRAAGRAAVPATPTLLLALSEGITTKPGLTDAQRRKVIADVAWVQGRLGIILPRIHWTGAKVRTDGTFDATTAAAVRFFEFWANVARSMFHQPALFPTISGVVDTHAASILAIVGGYYQNHPLPGQPTPTPAPTATTAPTTGGGASSSPTADQAAALASLNHDRSARGLRQLTLHAQLTAKAQAWSAHLASMGALSHSVLTDGVTFCWKGLAENVGYGRSVESIEAAFIADVGVNPPTHRMNIENGSFDAVGIGVTVVNGVYWLVQDFLQSC